MDKRVGCAGLGERQTNRGGIGKTRGASRSSVGLFCAGLFLAFAVTAGLGAQTGAGEEAGVSAGADSSARSDFSARGATRSHLAVELGHPVYAVIEAAELRGAVNRLSSIKPYTRAQVSELLATIQGQLGLFSQMEREEIARLAAEFSAGSKGDIGQALWRASNDRAALGAHIEAAGRLDVAGLADLVAGGISGAGSGGYGSWTGDPADLWHLNSLFQAYIKAYPESWLSLWGTIGVTYDKVNRDLFLPYSFTKQWDAHHNKVSTSPYSDGEEPYPTWSFDLRSDIAGATDSGAFSLRLSRFRRDWGVGSGSLALSGTARPFMGLEAQFRPSELFAVSHMVGSLGNWEKGSADRSTDLSGGVYTAVTEQKMLAIQRLELFPFDWLSIGASGSMIGAKRFELGYLSPMMFAVEYQVTQSDVDNMALHGDIQVFLKRFGKLYVAGYIDEMELSGFDEWFSKARNMFAYQGGLKLDLPWLPFGVFTAQYTKIEPFVYTHPPTWNSDTRLRVNTNYTNDGENLGYHLKPNSDELLFRLDARLGSGWRGSIEYSFIRHGDDPRAYVTTNHYIYGDVEEYLDYGGGVADYAKNFLHDGVYDYNHLLTLRADWRPVKAPKLFGAAVPLELGLGYGLSYTWYEDGIGSGTPLKSPEWKNLLELKAKFFL